LVKAILAYQEFLKLDQNNADRALQTPAYQAAANLFIGAIQVDPMWVGFHANLGLSQAQSGNLEAVRTQLIRAMLFSPVELNHALNLNQLNDQAGRRGPTYSVFRASSLYNRAVCCPGSNSELSRGANRPEVSNIALLHALKLDLHAPHA
jgi:hypothetical protein